MAMCGALLGLAPPVRAQLNRAGFTATDEVLELSPIELAEELEITRPEALKILDDLRRQAELGKPGPAVPTTAGGLTAPVTATDLLAEERARGSIITFSDALDGLIGNGIPLAKVTEVCGAPGIGKTQFGIQLAVSAQIPAAFGGVDGEVVYIDTEGSFVPERAMDMAEALVRALQESHAAAGPDTAMAGAGGQIPTAEEMLGRMHYFRVHNYIEQLAVVQILPDFVASHPAVKLVVIDSVAFHFRRDFQDMVLRTRLLNGMAQNLLQLARAGQLAVVLTNQMTTKSSAHTSSHLVPALGESWGHASTIRLILYWKHGVRRALLYKSPSEREASVAYQVTLAGIRDLDDHHHIDDDSNAATGQASERGKKRLAENVNDNAAHDDDYDGAPQVSRSRTS